MLAALALFAVLFPAPLHLTREVTDPVSGTKTVIDEYCHGNRVVSVSGSRTSIAEYDKGVVTIIDFDAGTYSVTKFDELAKAWEKPGRERGKVTAQARLDDWRVEQRGARVVASRAGEAIEARSGDRTIRLTADRELSLGREAAEVLLGIAYPSPRDHGADVVLNALRSDDRYALPLEHVVQLDDGGETLEVRNTIVRVGSEPAPADVQIIPAGAKLVESNAIAARRMLEELDGARRKP